MADPVGWHLPATIVVTVKPSVPPLAERLRPRTLGEVIGQQHLLGPGMPLRIGVRVGPAAQLHPVGPAGRGQDHHRAADGRCVRRAVHQHQRGAGRRQGHPRGRGAAEGARDGWMQQRTIVFVDEVHRFNKSQQDAFLPHVESGLFTFIGATTENPSFEVNSALLSRAAVYVLQPLVG
jgi:putative ATPase